MRGPKKSGREKDLTGRYFAGRLDEDRVEAGERFGSRSKNFQQNKIVRTAEKRAADAPAIANIDALPAGEVVQVFSLYAEVMADITAAQTAAHLGLTLLVGTPYLCVVRKTLNKLAHTQIVVGDRVRFLPIEQTGRGDSTAEGIIERVEPRQTVLTRADSFKAIVQHPIVANAEQMLIVASMALPTVKWGLIDRMLIAAQAGGLTPIVCVNKADLREEFPKEAEKAEAALAHYASLGIATLMTSVKNKTGLDDLSARLHNRVTVLAGHSGVGKSSLIRAIEPTLDLRIGEISGFNQKGRHTTTSARRYPLTGGGSVIDTPGVKLFGLWQVTAENLPDFFPDIEADTAPDWRKDSFERIAASLG